MKSKITVAFLLLTSFIYSKAQVSLQTGAAEVNIPLYTYSDPNNRMGTGVSLVYTSGNGLKVSEVAPSVGTGWLLNCGGSITRIQNGEPDDQKQNGTFSYPSGTEVYFPSPEFSDFLNYANNYYPNGYLYSEFNATTQMDNGGAYVPMFTNNWKYKPAPKYMTDREQDFFSFSFNGRTGLFIISKESPGVPSEIKTLTESKLKIDKITTDMSANNIRTTISEFHITDETGIKYVFKEHALSEVIAYDSVFHYTYAYPNGTYAPGTYYYNPIPCNDCRDLLRGRPLNQFVINKWYLSEIVNPATNIKIVFTYESFNVDMYGSKLPSLSVVNDKEKLVVTLERIKGVEKRIKVIDCSSKEKVEFNYSSAARVDLPFDKQLNDIAIKYDNEIKNTWKFTYGYFVRNDIYETNSSFSNDDKIWTRLCLKSVQKEGLSGSLEPAYLFSYYVDPNNNTFEAFVPPMFSIYTDHWGYYNASPNVWAAAYGPAEVGYNFHDLMWTEYPIPLKNANTYRQPYSTMARNGILKSIQYPAGGQLTFEYEQNAATSQQAQVTMGGVRVKKTLLYDGLDHSKDIINEYKYLKADGVSSSGWGYETGVYSPPTALPLQIWRCTAGTKYPGAQFKDVPSLTVIHQITNFNTMGFSIKGTITFGVQQVATAIAVDIITNILHDLLGSDFDNFNSTEYNWTSSILHNPLPFYYSRVEVINKLLSDNIGKTVYEFTSDQDYAVEIPVLSFPYSGRTRTAFWAYGLPKVVSVYDKYGSPVKKIENSYQYFKSTFNGTGFGSQKWAPYKRLFACDFQLVPGQPSTDITSDTYYPIYGRTELTHTKEYFYNNSGENIFVTTEFEYSPLNYQLKKIKTTNSKGELIENSTYYPDDYTLGGAIQEMKNKNMVGVPVSTQTVITKSGSQKYLTAGSVSEYSILSNNDIKLTKTYTFRSDQPIAENQVSFNGNQLLPNSAYYKETGTIDYYKQVGGLTYQAAGLPIQVSNDAGKVSTIYDYNNQLPIATVANAAIEDIAYTSFESDGSGGWNITFPAVIEDYSPTGKKCLKLFSIPTSINKTIDNTKSYILSFWSKSGVPYVFKISGTTPQTFSPVKTFPNSSTGWTYYEYLIAATSTIYLDNSLNGTQSNSNEYYIDELRLYPSNSRMSTVTYDPLIGKTTECDANNHITFYEYDNLGRLKVIRDENRNVIKAYEYNYKQ